MIHKQMGQKCDLNQDIIGIIALLYCLYFQVFIVLYFQVPKPNMYSFPQTWPP